MIEFYKTPAGRRLFDQQIPQMVRQLGLITAELAKMNAMLQDLWLVSEHVEEKAAEVQESFLDQERMECARHTLAGAIGQIKKAKGE